MASLLLGAGNSRKKKFFPASAPDWNGPLTTIDMDPNCGADVVWNLEQRPLPFPEESFDEIGAYDVLEHWGTQGDWRAYFDEFAEYWRLLKPTGTMSIIVPVNKDALADPGHTRFFHQNHFAFLDQDFYAENIAKGTACTDYRWYWKRCFRTLVMRTEPSHMGVILQKA